MDSSSKIATTVAVTTGTDDPLAQATTSVYFVARPACSAYKINMAASFCAKCGKL